MKPSLQVRLSQHLALTPQLQQSIRLLQLSTLELQQEVEQMLEQNPFLEAEEETGPAQEPPPPERISTAQDDTDGRGLGEGSDDVAGVDNAEFGTTEREDWANGTEGDDFDGIRETPSLNGQAAPNDGDDDSEAHERMGAGPSLAAHLRSPACGCLTKTAPRSRC
jgi:RNA polymerase sigma-54 factor